MKWNWGIKWIPRKTPKIQFCPSRVPLHRFGIGTRRSSYLFKKKWTIRKGKIKFGPGARVLAWQSEMSVMIVVVMYNVNKQCVYAGDQANTVMQHVNSFCLRHLTSTCYKITYSWPLHIPVHIFSIPFNVRKFSLIIFGICLVAQAVRRSPPTSGVLSSRLGHSMWVSW